MPVRMKSGERRAAIVASAVRLFAEKGFRGATTRELAAAAGVTEPVLYQHFATKRELYDAIIEAKAEQGQERTEELKALAETGDDRAYFRALAGMIFSGYEEDPDFVRLLLFSILERHELAGMFYDRRMLQFHDQVAGYIRQRMQAGAFRAANPNVAARAFIGVAIEFAANAALFGRPTVRCGRNKLIDEIVTLFLNGIAGENA